MEDEGLEAGVGQIAIGLAAHLPEFLTQVGGEQKQAVAAEAAAQKIIDGVTVFPGELDEFFDHDVSNLVGWQESPN